MCTYNITLDDQLVNEAKHTLEEGVAFPLWLQQQVELLLMAQVGHFHSRRRKKHTALSDEQLAKELEQLKPLTDADFPELSKEDYSCYLKNSSGCISKGLEKWL